MRFNKGKSKICYEHLLKEINKGNISKKKLVIEAQKVSGLKNKGYVSIILKYVCYYNKTNVLIESNRNNRIQDIMYMKENKISELYYKINKKYGITYRQFDRDLKKLEQQGKLTRKRDYRNVIVMRHIGHTPIKSI